MTDDKVVKLPVPAAQQDKDADEHTAEAPVKKFTQNQQGLHDWAASAVQRHAKVIRLALDGPPPVEEDLRRELEAAGTRFNLNPVQVWRVLQKRYRESDAHICALAEEFVTKWEAELREANDRERLGEIDDEEDLELDRTGETEPESVKIRVKTKEFIEAIHKETKRDEGDIKLQLRAVMRDHPNIGEISSNPPGAHVWMRVYGRFRVTPRGVFAPISAGLFDWERISKTPLDPFAHSLLYLTDQDPRAHLVATTYEGERGIRREIEIPRGVISIKSVSTAIKVLTQFNVYVVRSDFAREQTVDFLNFKPKNCKIVRVRTTGWLKLEDGYHFVLPLVPPDLEPISPTPKGALVTRRSVAKSQPKIILRLDRPIGSANRTYGFHVAGTVEEWQRIVKPLEGCSNVGLAAGVGFAAPLVAFADEQTGGFHIWSESSRGKTAAGTIGESIYGYPSAITNVANDIERFGAKWATASDVGPIALAQKRTDVGLYLDDFRAGRSLREQAIELIYTFTGGAPKLRADSRGDLRQQSGFRTLMFSTGEFPLRKLLEKLDDTEGRKKRLVDVPALVGEKTALETVPHDKLGEVCPAIYANAARFHGAVGQAWLRHLVDLGEAAIRVKLEQHRKTWFALPEIAELLHRDPKDDSVIRRFALLAAALRMAHEAGLWPWSIESSDRAILACTLRWAQDKDASVATLEQKAAVQKLREAILAACAANRFIVLNRQLGGRGGSSFKPVPERAVMYEDLDAFKKSGTLLGFIKNDGVESRILLYRDAFDGFSAECGLERNGLVDYLQRARVLEIKNESVKGKTDQYYVLAGTFLHEETSAPNQ